MDLAQEVLKYNVCPMCRKAFVGALTCGCGDDPLNYESILMDNKVFDGEKRERIDEVVRQYRTSSNKPFFLAVIDFQKAYGVRSQFYPQLINFLGDVGLSAPRKKAEPAEGAEAKPKRRTTKKADPEPVKEEPATVTTATVAQVSEAVEHYRERVDRSSERIAKYEEAKAVEPSTVLPPPIPTPKPPPPVVQTVPLAMLYVELAFAQSLSNANTDLGRLVRFAGNNGQVSVTELAEAMEKSVEDTIAFVQQHAKAPWSRYASMGVSEDQQYVYCELKPIRTIGEVMTAINKAKAGGK